MTTPLPAIRGQYRHNVSLADSTWFRVGGPATLLFKPADADDLSHFLRTRPDDLSVTVLGVGSNLIVRDGGIDGVVVRLGRGFTSMVASGDVVQVGAACLDVHVAEFAAQHQLDGLAFLSGIPGTIGGALRMNAGAYGREIRDVLIEATGILPDGTIRTFTKDEMGLTYRHCALPEGVIFTHATLRTTHGDERQIRSQMDAITNAREASQPTRSRTGGSTFANPPAHKAWELIDAAGCRGMIIGGAQVSEKHCNFLINIGGATAADIEQLGETIRDKVYANSGIRLEWEIRRIGNQKADE